VPPACGDGAVDPGEECDDGNADDTDACTAACLNAVCGDSFTQMGVEGCDDGNMVDGDGCSAACVIESCGDGVMQGMETCDDGNLVDTDACTSLCAAAACGDSFVQEGVEACDDGNLEDNDGCTAACVVESCGDGITQLSEECDDANMDDADACTTMCLAAICGDSIVYQGMEQCDDGNMDDTDDCVQGCLTASCGDTFVQAGVEDCEDANMDNTDACVACNTAACGDGFVQMGVEGCDDGNVNSLDGCSSTCVIENRKVFVTSTLHTGNMGGLAGADAICNTRAAAANLTGTYMAWLSTSEVNGTPATRFVQSAVPYLKVNGVKVADNWADLIDGTLDSPIDVTETGGATPIGTFTCQAKSVWTGTNANGTLYNNGLNSCTNWTSTVSNTGALWGYPDSAAGTWTIACSGGSCGWQEPIYCFQQ
jgi:cysteine-rich repeat protein